MNTKEVEELLSGFMKDLESKGLLVFGYDGAQVDGYISTLNNSASGKARSIHVNEQTKKCDSCNGSGYINEDTFQESECDSCAGSGIIT